MDEITYEDGVTFKKGDKVRHRYRGYHGHVIGILVRKSYTPSICVKPIAEEYAISGSHGNMNPLPVESEGKTRSRWVKVEDTSLQSPTSKDEF